MLWFGFLFLSLAFAITSVSGAPWVPARKKDISKILDDIDIKKNDVFYELGCGDGRLVRAAALRGAQAVGYELNPFIWVVAWVRCLGVSGAKVRLKNLWSVDLSKANVVLAFLVPRTMPRLHAKAKKELRSGSTLVSYIFPIEELKSRKSSGSWFIYKY